ncbi:hypothetical protein D3C71_2153530 [compost metagenome]
MAGAKGREFGGGLRAGLAVTGTDVDSRAGFEEGFGDHLADAAGAAGHQGGAALQGEIGVHGESC